MTKKHEKPEFQVIRQNEANAKFFVASGGNTGGGSMSGVPISASAASSYSTGTMGGSWQ